MNRNLTLLIASAFLFIRLSGQSYPLIIPPNIVLPFDSAIKNKLLHSLNEFLILKEKPNSTNPYILNEDLPATSALLDEMKEIEKSGKYKDDHFYKAYLMNMTQLPDSNYLIQISYIGNHNDTSLLRASFSLIAKKSGAQFYFNSPLKQNTLSWKFETIDHTRLYFKTKLNIANAKNYFKYIDRFDKKLSAPKLPTEFYCCDNFQEALHLAGVDYKSDYNGYAQNNLTATENNTVLIVNGSTNAEFKSFDPHDLWHSRSHKVISTTLLNRPVDEGIAYLYGGSWGYSWKQVLEKFKIFASSNPNADWLALYNESKNYDEKGKYPLNIDFIINALIVQKLENEKGFSAVIELLSCGKKEKGNENYFRALEKLTGITKADYNEKVWDLIKTN